MITRRNSNKSVKSVPQSPWQLLHVNPIATQSQRRWLKRAGALTAGLRLLGELELRVIREATVMPAADERIAMQLAGHQPIHVREICMSINGLDCVVARSTVDMRAWTGSWQAIGRLGRRPLADILYNDSRVTRSAFETGRLRNPHPLARLALRHDTSPPNAQAYWARRSLFWRDGHALLVAECFLPAFWQIIDQQSDTNR